MRKVSTKQTYTKKAAHIQTNKKTEPIVIRSVRYGKKSSEKSPAILEFSPV
jgi:hypothetical protein